MIARREKDPHQSTRQEAALAFSACCGPPVEWPRRVRNRRSRFRRDGCHDAFPGSLPLAQATLGMLTRDGAARWRQSSLERTTKKFAMGSSRRRLSEKQDRHARAQKIMAINAQTAPETGGAQRNTGRVCLASRFISSGRGFPLSSRRKVLPTRSVCLPEMK